MATNPNYPRIEHGWGTMWNASGGSSPIDRFVDLAPRTQGQASTGRGRQYETDQVQTGTLTLTVSNNDGALDPTNVSGPWFGGILPYQPYRERAQWPPTRNLLSPALASAEGLPLGTSDQGITGPGMFGVNGASVVASSSAYVGTQVWQAVVNSGTGTTGTSPLWTGQPAVIPGATYTFSLRVRNITDSTSISMQARIFWTGPVPNGPSLLISNGTAAALTGSSTAAGWTTLTVTATAPANCTGVEPSLGVAATTTATCTVQSDGWQWEEGATVTAYQDPGTWYPMLSGYVERWPQTWLQDNTFSVVQPTAVDAFALLSQRPLSDPLTEEINSHSPRFLYKLDDPAGSGQATDATGNYGPAPVNVSKFGKGSLTFGNSITATDPVNGIFTGSSGTVCSISNASPGTNIYAAATYLSMGAVGITGPTNPAGDWARMLAFRYTGPTPTAQAVMWSSLGRVKAGLGSALMMWIGSDGALRVEMAGPTGAATPFSPVATSLLDGNWHLVVASFRGASRALTVNIDGAGNGATIPASCIPDSLVYDYLGAYVDPGTGGAATWNYKGDIAFAAEFPSFLSDQAIFDLQAAWRNSFVGDSTDVRYKRILKYAGYAGAQDIQAGQTRSMGPAQIAGQDALSALSDVVATEGGTHYVSASGRVTFVSRAYRYNAGNPVATFGEHESAGEFPYESIDLDYDPTHLGNIVEVTQPGTGQVFTAQDAASQTKYFERTISRSVNASDPLECQDAAWYLVSRYKDPATRIVSLVLNPSSNPSLWAVCLGLELNARIRVIRRPLGRPAITLDAFVEHIQWDLDDQNNARLTLQCSPADLTVYGSFAAWHTTLSTGASAGASTFTIAAGQDNTNPLAAQLAQGQQLLLSPGTVNSELVTVNSVGATTAGWTTAAITTVSPLTKSHAANDVVCEALPAGVTDPTTWDAVSKFDQHAFVY